MHRSATIRKPRRRDAERGGITILVALMLLVLLTVAAIGMSRNSFREILISASARQGAMARNLADSGIEFGILWMRPPNQLSGLTGTSAAQLQSLASDLQTGTLLGKPYNLNKTLYSGTNTATPAADLQVPAGSGNGFNLSLTAMGTMFSTDRMQTAGSVTDQGNKRAAGGTVKDDPDMWALRADGVITVAGTTFTHSKEAWISTEKRQQ